VVIVLSDALIALLLSGGIGYALGRAPFQQWETYINNYNDRLGRLAYDRVVEPLEFYQKIQNSQKLYAEAIFAYLVGLEDASLPVTMRCLELGLKEHFRQVENAEPSMTSYRLIEWAEKSIGNKKELAHGFRILRNLIHEEKVIEEQDALEAIRHVTMILNNIFPFSNAIISGACNFCNTTYNLSIPLDQCYLGNTIVVQCNKCRRSINHNIMPPYP
jgi:hypothetical protein